MGRLSPGEFLVELDKLFANTKDKGSVYVIAKRSACPVKHMQLIVSSQARLAAVVWRSTWYDQGTQSCTSALAMHQVAHSLLAFGPERAAISRYCYTDVLCSKSEEQTVEQEASRSAGAAPTRMCTHAQHNQTTAAFHTCVRKI